MSTRSRLIYVGNLPTGQSLYAMPHDIFGLYSWHEAKEMAATCSLDSYTDWRLPTREELELMTLAGAVDGAWDDWHWSSTQHDDHAICQNFYRGRQAVHHKSGRARVRYVRSG